jgi:hypothetical protein
VPRLDRMQIYAYSTLTVKNEERYVCTVFESFSVHRLQYTYCTRTCTSVHVVLRVQYPMVPSKVLSYEGSFLVCFLV